MNNSTISSLRQASTDAAVYLPPSFRYLWYRSGLVSLFFIGVPLNLLIISLTVKYDFAMYKWFLLNLAALDVLASVAYALQGLMYFFPAYDGFWCAVAGFALPFSLLTAYTNLVPISFNRFVAIVVGPAWYERVFTGRNVLAICIVSDALMALLLAPSSLIYGRLGRRTWGLGDCNLIPRNLTRGSLERRMTNLIAESLMFVILPMTLVSLLANLAIYAHVRRHLRRVTELRQRDRLEQTRQLCHAALLQLVAPVAVQLPFTLIQVVVNADDDAFADGGVLFTSYYAFLVLVCSLPIVDALITLYVVKPYRQKLIELITAKEAAATDQLPMQPAPNLFKQRATAANAPQIEPAG